jgi:hypothetical protein
LDKIGEKFNTYGYPLYNMVATLGKDAPPYTTVNRCMAELKINDPRPGSPYSVHGIVMNDRQGAESRISSSVGISQERVHLF